MKILLLTENVSENELVVLKQGVEQVKVLLPQLDFTFQVTNAKFTSIPFANNVARGFLLDNTQILTLVNGDFDIACLVYDWTTLVPQPTNPSTSLVKKNNCIPMAIPKQWYGSPNGFPEIFAEFFLHELCHAEAFRSGQQDLTHMKYDPIWSNQWGQKPNNDYYMFLLRKYMVNTPTVTITREQSDNKQTLGKLRTSDGMFGCDTLEKPWLNNQVNISCIPKGTYICKWKFMLRKLTYHYQIMNVPNRSGIFFHAGNFFFDIAGCILLGSLPQDINKDGEKDVINSRIIVNAFEAKMGKKDFNLIIQ